MTLLRALNGALLASLRPVASGIIADVTSEQRRGKVYGVVQFCTNIGLMAGKLKKHVYILVNEKPGLFEHVNYIRNELHIEYMNI